MTLEKTKLTVELVDGTVHDIVVGNASLCSWDRAHASYGWPSMQEAPFLWMSYIAWHHMKAAKLIPSDTKYDVFESELCIAIGDTDAEAKAEAEAAGKPWEAEAVDPTATSPELDSASP